MADLAKTHYTCMHTTVWSFIGTMAKFIVVYIILVLNVFCSDAAYTVGLILLNEKAIETTDANKKKSKFMVIYHVYTVHGGDVLALV